MDMEKLLEKMGAYGADTVGINERFLGDAGLYTMCLGLFLEDTNFDKLEQSIAQADYQAAFEAAHTLKGVAGNLGLTPIYAPICTLVEDLRAKRYDGLAKQYRAIKEQYALVKALKE